MKLLKNCMAAVCVAALAQGAIAQDSPTARIETSPVAAPSTTTGNASTEELLGGTFQNPLAGIAFRVPRSCNPAPKAAPDDVARFASDDKSWEMSVSKTSSAQPLPLTETAPKMGLLEVTAGRLKQTTPGIEIVRQDTINLEEYPAGIIVGRVTVGSQRKLLQQAMIQANEQLYYTIALTTPASKDAKGADSDDPGEKVAAATFRQLLDTVKLLDRTPIADDQKERLYRTRAFFVDLNADKLRSVLVPEQWLRLQREGRDVGYTYIVEEPDNRPKSDGIKIGIRSRSYPDADTQVDGETWFNVSGDRKHETWSNVVWVQNQKTKTSDHFTEFGSSDQRITRSLDTTGTFAPGEGKDEKQPPIKISEETVVRVQTIGKSASADPMTQRVPPWYIPQAIGHLLPRLLPLQKPKTFMFATYVGDNRTVMHRYVDVGTEQEVALGGKRVRAVPVSERLGLEGSATIHYVSPEGKYLGSENKESKITILASSAEELQKIFANKADLSRPVEQKMPAAPAEPAKKH